MQRLASGVALAAVALAAILYVPSAGLRGLAGVVAVVAASEYLRLVLGAGLLRQVPWLALVAAVAWTAAAPSEAALLGLGSASLVGMGLEAGVGRRPWSGAALAALAPWYVGAPLGLLAGIHAQGGPWAALTVVAVVAVSDSGQYYTGRAFGRTPLAPAVSPKKTVEGAVGGVLLAAAFLAVAGPRVAPSPEAVSEAASGVAAWAAVGVAMAVLGICGDLFESKLKRAAGVKDSAALIPGHGGALDRIDALLFAIPVFHVCLRVLT